MNDRKSALSSMTLIGLVILGLTFLANKLGLKVGEGEIQEIAEWVVGVIGAMLTFAGRWRKGDLYLVDDKDFKPPIGLLFVALLSLSLIGCASTPEARWYQSRSALNTANQILIVQEQAGNLTDDQIIKWGGVLKDWRAALEAAKTQLPRFGEKPGAAFIFYMDVAEKLLIQWELRHKETRNGSRDDSIGFYDRQGDYRVCVRATEHRQRKWGDYRPAKGRYLAASGAHRCASGRHRRGCFGTAGRIGTGASWRAGIAA